MPGASPTLEREWSLLKAACSFENPGKETESLHSLLCGPIRWKLLFDRAEAHGVQPLLHQLLSSAPDLVPREEMLALDRASQTNLHKALFLSRELIRVVDRLQAISVDVLPYKGVALAETVYGDIALRQAGDIDLLIRPQDFARARKSLRELGYQPHLLLSERQERAYLKSGYECAFDSDAGRNLVEVQWAIQPRFYAVDFDMDALFQRAVAVTVAGRSMEAPSAEDMFLVLSLHAAKHVWERLIWLSDIARIMSSPCLDWSFISSRARSMGIVRIVRVSLILTNRLLGTPIPAAAETSLPTDPEATALANPIQDQIINGTIGDSESFGYFRLMLQLRERRFDRLRFLTRLAFTPGPSEWAAVRFPEPLFPLYRLVRLSRLLARLVGA